MKRDVDDDFKESSSGKRIMLDETHGILNEMRHFVSTFQQTPRDVSTSLSIVLPSVSLNSPSAAKLRTIVRSECGSVGRQDHGHDRCEYAASGCCLIVFREVHRTLPAPSRLGRLSEAYNSLNEVQRFAALSDPDKPLLILAGTAVLLLLLCSGLT